MSDFGIRMEVHDVGHDQPTLCVVLSETPHGTAECQVVAVFEDDDRAREAARRLCELLEVDDE